jgi:UDP-N-acetylmuramyl pentapeptide phosphotransferase/UDP-N-acetylglucosamine-1-phosphate transferase
MKVGTLVGLILVVAGLIGVAYGGITYTRRREVARVGPLQVTTREEHTIPISPIAGGIAILAGAALIVAVRRAR